MTKTMKSIWLVMLSALFLTTVGAAGCGGDDDDGAATDADTDADTDTDTDTDTDADTDTGTEWPEDCVGFGDCEDWDECSCDPSDPCGWGDDGFCDGYCLEGGIVEEMFDDGDACTGPCTGMCDLQDGIYVACTCAVGDPCGWAEDGFCDEACITGEIVEEMFDDSVDCE